MRKVLRMPKPARVRYEELRLSLPEGLTIGDSIDGVDKLLVEPVQFEKGKPIVTTLPSGICIERSLLRESQLKEAIVIETEVEEGIQRFVFTRLQDYLGLSDASTVLFHELLKDKRAYSQEQLTPEQRGAAQELVHQRLAFWEDGLLFLYANKGRGLRPPACGCHIPPPAQQ